MKPDATDSPETLARKKITDLEAQYADVRRDGSDEGRRQRAQLSAKLARLTHEQIHPDEELVEIDVPPAVMGEPFLINEYEFSGLVVVPRCVAQTLLYMIEQNRRVDRERMQERGRTVNLGQIGATARAILAD